MTEVYKMVIYVNELIKKEGETPSFKVLIYFEFQQSAHLLSQAVPT